MRHIIPVGSPAAAQADLLQAVFTLINCLFGGCDPFACLSEFVKTIIGS